jgi:lipopolysaccharide export system permease protein
LNVLARYLVRTVLSYTGLVALVLGVLGALFIFINEQDDIGVGTYTTTEALAYVALNLPTYLFQLLPAATLIGALLGLGNLARGNELVVMRAAGVSTIRLCSWLGVAGVLLATLMFLGSEFVAPPLGQYARQMKMFSRFSEWNFAGKSGTWVRDGNTIIGIHDQSARTRFGGVQVVRLGPGQTLLSVGRAETASVGANNRWSLDGYAETRFGESGAQATQSARQELRTTIPPEFLGLATMDTEVMGLRDLLAYIGHLQGNDLDARHFQIAFWARIARMAAVLLVVMLALPFAMGPMRATGQGLRTVIGIMIGAAFIVFSQMVENGGQLLGLEPWLVGSLPTAMLAVVTGLLLRRAR